MNEKIFNIILSISAFFISAILGVASFYLGFINKESPCILCWAHRMLMIGIAMFTFFIIRYGPKPKYVGWIIFISIFGIFAGLRHSSGSFAWDIHQGWWAEILGAHTYTWAMVIQGMVLVFTAILFWFTTDVYNFVSSSYKPLTLLTKSTLTIFIIVICGNIVQAFMSTGLPPNIGVGSPARLSFDPHYWYWTTDSWKRLSRPVSFRGNWNIESPSLPSDLEPLFKFDVNPESAPISATNKLIAYDKKVINLKLNSPATDITFNGNDKYFITTEKWGLYLINKDLDKIERFSVLDHLNGANGRVPVGSAFINENEFGIIGWNKVFVFFKVDNSLSDRDNFPNFIEGLNNYKITSRGVYNTVRARMSHVLSMAYLPDNNSIYTITVPDRVNNGFVISRFDKDDNLLSEEFTPTLKEGITVKNGRSIKDYYITGLTSYNGDLYAVSKQFSQILRINPVTKEIINVYQFNGIKNAQGITFNNDIMQVISYEDGINVVYSLSE